MILQQGKYKGWHITQVPSFYLEWITQSHFEDDVKKSARIELDRRIINQKQFMNLEK